MEPTSGESGSEKIDDFLQKSAASGQEVAVEESFTLAPEKIWVRLQQVLPKKEYWLLKLVQAAVAWGAPSIRLAVTDDKFSAAFALPNPAPDPEDFWKTDVLSGPFHHLRVAVATVCGQQDMGVIKLDWQTAQHSVRFSWKGEDHHREELSPGEQTPGLRLNIVPAEGTWLSKFFRGDLFHEEFYALKERLVWGTVKIHLNGEPLSRLEPEEALFRPVLAETTPNENHVSSLHYRFHRSLVLPRYLDFMKSSKTKQRRGDYGSRLMPGTATTFHWILDGVVIDRWRRDSAQTAVAADIHLSALGLELDLSGFALVPSDQAEARVSQTGELQRKMLQQAKNNLPHKLEHAIHREKVKASVYGVDLFVGFLFPPYLLLGLVEVFRLPKVSTRLLETDLALCREHIEKRAENLATFIES